MVAHRPVQMFANLKAYYASDPEHPDLELSALTEQLFRKRLEVLFPFTFDVLLGSTATGAPAAGTKYNWRLFIFHFFFQAVEQPHTECAVESTALPSRPESLATSTAPLALSTTTIVLVGITRLDLVLWLIIAQSESNLTIADGAEDARRCFMCTAKGDQIASQGGRLLPVAVRSSSMTLRCIRLNNLILAERHVDSRQLCNLVK